MSDLKVCPSCGSPAVTYTVLLGSDAECRACTWHGKSTDLLTLPGAPDELARQRLVYKLAMELKAAYLESAAPFMRVLNRFGFLTDPKDNKRSGAEGARYLQAMGSAAVGALLRVREELEKEARAPAPRSGN